MGFNRCRSLQSSPFDSLVPSSTILENRLLKWGDKKVTWDYGKPFILTSAMQKSYEMVFLAFSQRWPVLLYGPAGAGKTALISKLAELHGGRVLFLHMDEQVDGKMLVGTYVCRSNLVNSDGSLVRLPRLFPMDSGLSLRMLIKRLLMFNASYCLC